MAQKFDYPKNESEFRNILDDMYQNVRDCIANGESPKIKGLIEIMSSETAILTAIHKLKSNHGSETPGTDGQRMRDILESDYEQVIAGVQGAFRNYNPHPIRRTYIPKLNKPGEKRPLGIPAIVDRIVQECVRSVIEPILEAQFFSHSYGFRPMRDAHMALQRVTDIVHYTGYHWIIEGDISKFFDEVNHTKLIKKLWHLGIRDRRVLVIINKMLKAGIMDELEVNPLGTQQGGIISPLLANAYLDTLDQWIVREWEEKKTQKTYADKFSARKMLQRRSNLKPAYLIRYADDWVLVTQTKSNAEKWKRRISKYLETNLKLRLSAEKTLITNVRKKPIRFLGFTYKVTKGKARKGFIARTRPNPQRLKDKVEEIRKDIRNLRKLSPRQSRLIEELIHQINVINSKIRGVIQYYEAATWVNMVLSKEADRLRYTAYKALKRFGGTWTPANELSNLHSVHSNYTTAVPAIVYRGLKIGITSFAFCKWRMTYPKMQNETPYSKEGREIYRQRTGKKRLLARADDLLTLSFSQAILWKEKDSKRNFEYYLNRPYAFNRDRGKCRVCQEPVQHDVNIHHIQPHLPLEFVNRVANLATLHKACHDMIHDGRDYEDLLSKMRKRILRFREKLST
ncbi:group II intron reverse transcriptase/maturase [Ferviditalea candida]|uniref:Group II intron reverse transcriptase/maturase n=1 Tax=Ferviditalea candida TaxID=3108399 RepID=A0ABU5ZNR2_9BACL|nr:group II intron reverse transcriptase/maturase [Paenibacillaceae bacterium T2]